MEPLGERTNQTLNLDVKLVRGAFPIWIHSHIYIYMCSCFMLLFAVLMFCSVHERDALHRGVKNPVPGGS